MKIFVSYSSADRIFVQRIVSQLKKAGHSVLFDMDMPELITATNVSVIIKQGLDEADIILAFITDSYNNSSFASFEFGAASLGSPEKLLPVVIGNATIPSFMSGILYLKFEHFESDIAKRILLAIESMGSKTDVYSIASEQEIKLENTNKYIDELKTALYNNRLTLVCGAGISVSAGIPSWNDLLLSMLNRCISAQYKFNAKSVQHALPMSNIILGKYLKIMLGENFENTLKECLYDQLGEDQTYFGKKVYKETALIHEFINLLKPKRNGGNVESVITFNFDSLLEDTLNKYGIENQAIYDEGMIANSGHLPIYHVHGYLPQVGEIKTPNIVFSEEAYHTQFVDPYSWSNLVQLYKYMENTCFLIGLSITDPNLRRLLDISKRKNHSTQLRHYIVKKKPCSSDDSIKTQILLEEKDANSLGLNVFWIDDFEEIPDILRRIAQ